MNIIDINDRQAVALAIKTLRTGGIVMHPTETCYGFAVDIFNKSALDKLYRIKGMAKTKPVSVLIDGLAMAEQYGEFSETAHDLAAKHWPGALSIIVPRKDILPEFFNEGEGFVSMRHSSNEFCTAMVSGLVGPISTTSVNRTGEPHLYDVDLSQFGELSEEIDLIVDGGEIAKNEPSTIVKVDGDSVVVLRQGDVLL